MKEPTGVRRNCNNTQQAADILNVSPRTLEKWRTEGKGPSFCKFGSRVIYTREQLAEYQRKNTHRPSGDVAS